MSGAVLLDVDGTLVDSTFHHAMGWYRALRRCDVVVPVARVHRAVGMGGDQLVAAVAGDEVERTRGDELRALWAQEVADDVGRIRPLPGAVDLLRALHDRGAVVVLATSSPPDHTEVYLDLLGARDLVAGWTTADDVETTKPAPDVLAVALETVGASTGVVVGDSIWDARSAGRAGLPCHGVLTGGVSAAELTDAGCRAVHETPGDLVAHLDGILADLAARG